MSKSTSATPENQSQGQRQEANSSWWQRAVASAVSTFYEYRSWNAPSNKFPLQPHSAVFIMGVLHIPATEKQREFEEEISAHAQRILWLTYRRSFRPISTSSCTTDSGWGCMLRTGQMLLAECLLRHYLGHDYKRRNPADPKVQEILALFGDTPDSPYSVHSFAEHGARLGTPVGHWFSPSIAGHVIAELVHRYASNLHCNSLRVYIEPYAASVTVKDVLEAQKTKPKARFPLGQDQIQEFSFENCQRDTPRPDGSWTPLLLLVPVRLGIGNRVDIDYQDVLLEYLEFPQSVGIVGGRPRASLFVYGKQGKEMLYLDPHVVQPSYDPKSPETLGRVFCNYIAKINVSKLDPCLIFGFYCATRAEFDDWIRRSQDIARKYTAQGRGGIAKVAYHVQETIVIPGKSISDDWEND